MIDDKFENDDSTAEVKERNWNVLYTSPRAEKQVKERLDKFGIECWLPLHRAPHVWSDRVKIVDVPLFNSYVFVRCNDETLRALPARIYGVAHLVYYDDKPAIIRPSEIEAIREFLHEAENHPLVTGDEVEIICGAMKNVSGVIRKINNRYTVLYLEQLGATVCVNVENVARLDRIK